jgi:ammonia channel protein AmtB
MAALAYYLTGLITKGHRVSAEAEELGLDLPEMGALAYPDTADLTAATVLTGHTPGVTKAAA